MSIYEENITELSSPVYQWITAFNNHDVAALVALYAEDAELFDAGMKRPRRGLKDIEQWFTRRFRDVPNIRYTPSGQLFAEVQMSVHWTTSGSILLLSLLSRSFKVDGVSIFTLRNGLIQKQRGYYDHLSVLEQVLPPLKWILPRRL